MYTSRTHIALGLGLLAAGTVFLFLGGPDYQSARSFKYSWDLGHVAYFALLTSMLIRWRLMADAPPTVRWITILTTAAMIGVSIELMQQAVSRTPSAGDVLRDVLGALLVLAFGSSSAALRPTGLRRSIQVAVLLVLSVQLWPLTKSLVDEADARQKLPLLSDFESSYEVERWVGNARRSVMTMGRDKVLKITFNTDRYSGLGLKYFDGDWSAYNTIELDLHNPDAEPLNITCRIHDQMHLDGNEEYEDRFNQSYRIVRGWNHIEIDLKDVKASPTGRDMDMRSIKGFGLHVVSQPTSRTIYLDKLRLSL